MSTAHKLVVVHPFADYKRGDVIENEELINQIYDLNHENHALIHHVVKTLKNNSEHSMSISTINDNDN